MVPYWHNNDLCTKIKRYFFVTYKIYASMKLKTNAEVLMQLKDTVFQTHMVLKYGIPVWAEEELAVNQRHAQKGG